MDTVKAGIIAGGEWYLSNLKPNGQVTYKVWPSENRYSNEYLSSATRWPPGTWCRPTSWTRAPSSWRVLSWRWTTQLKLKRGDVTEACKGPLVRC